MNSNKVSVTRVVTETREFTNTPDAEAKYLITAKRKVGTDPQHPHEGDNTHPNFIDGRVCDKVSGAAVATFNGNFVNNTTISYYSDADKAEIMVAVQEFVDACNEEGGEQ